MTKAEEILNSCIKSWEKSPHRIPSMRKLAQDAGLTHAHLQYHFTDYDGLKTAMAERAIADNNVPLIANLIISKHESVVGFSKQKRQKILSAHLG